MDRKQAGWRGARMITLLLGVSLLAGCTAAPANNWTGAQGQGSVRSQKMTETVPAGQFKGLTLKAGPGEVVVSGWAEPNVKVEVEKQASGADPAVVDSYLEGVKLAVKTNGDRVEVATVAPEQPPAGVKLVGVRYLIRVPNGLRGTLNLETDRATVRLAGVSGEATVKVRQADLNVQDFSGSLTAQFENGQAQVQRFDGQLDLKGNGPVEVSDSRLAVKGRIETVNSRLTLGLTDLSVGQYEFLTSNAPVRVTLPFGAAARFRIATTNGKVYDELPLTWIDRNETDTDQVYHFEGWLNAGGAQVGIVTTNADVTLAYR